MNAITTTAPIAIYLVFDKVSAGFLDVIFFSDSTSGLIIVSFQQ
jgi:hypothetical protein